MLTDMNCFKYSEEIIGSHWTGWHRWKVHFSEVKGGQDLLDSWSAGHLADLHVPLMLSQTFPGLWAAERAHPAHSLYRLHVEAHATRPTQVRRHCTHVCSPAAQSRCFQMWNKTISNVSSGMSSDHPHFRMTYTPTQPGNRLLCLENTLMVTRGEVGGVGWGVEENRWWGWSVPVSLWALSTVQNRHIPILYTWNSDYTVC